MLPKHPKSSLGLHAPGLSSDLQDHSLRPKPAPAMGMDASANLPFAGNPIPNSPKYQYN